MTRRRVRFSGTVQGVGFRAVTQSIAGRFPVSGWVRNEPDGSVLMEVQGGQNDITALLDALRRRMAGLIAAESGQEAPLVEGEQGFTIRR